MLVRRIALKNIRSYNDGEETVFEFPEGITLVEGDIGSGKSTLLYALEFALFGFSDLKGSHLLSEGRNAGRVLLSFESGGTLYTIERHLKVRGEEVVQDECYIASEGDRTRLSPSDLKERVVTILGFNEPTHPKAESLVYRYAVFTPQEQMKEILVQNSEERLHVVRRILGAQSYQVAAENSEVVERSVKEIAHRLKKQSESLQKKKEELESAAQDAASLTSEISRLEEKATEASHEVEQLEAKWKQSLGERETLGKAEALVPRLEEQIAELREEKEEHESNIQELETRLLEELEPLAKEF